MPQFLATTAQKRGFIWCDSFVVMTSNVNLDARPILQLFAIALCVVSQPLNRKLQKWFCVKFTCKVISWKLTDENHSCFLLMIVEQCGN